MIRKVTCPSNSVRSLYLSAIAVLSLFVGTYRLNGDETTNLIPKEDENHAIIFNTYEFTKSAIESEAFEKFAEVMNGMSGRELGTDEILAAVESVADFYPTRIVVTGDSRMTNTVDDALLLVYLFGLMKTADDGDYQLTKDEQTQIGKDLLGVIEGMEIPPMSIHIEFRNDIVARIASDSMLEGLEPMLKQFGLDAERDEKSLTVDGSMADAVEEFVLEILLRGYDALDRQDDVVTKLVESIRAKKLKFRVGQVGRGVRIDFMREEKYEPISVEKLGKNYLKSDSQIAYFRLQAHKGAAYQKKTSELIEAWKKRKVGEYFKEHDADGFTESMDQYLGAYEGAASEITGSLKVDAGMLIGDYDYKVEQPAAPIAEIAIANLLPADVDFVSAGSESTIAELIANQYLGSESRLELQGAGLSGNLNPNLRQGLVDGLEQYYESFRDFRSHLLTTLPELDSTPAALVADGVEKVDSVAVNLREDVGLKKVGPLQLPAFAFIVPAGEDSKKKVNAIGLTADHLAAAILDLFDEELQVGPESKMIEKVDLGLGLPTWGFKADLLPENDQRKSIRFESEGSFFIAESGEFLIISNSLKLTKRIVDKSSNRLEIGNKSAVGYTKVRSKVMYDFLDSFISSYTKVIPLIDPRVGDDVVAFVEQAMRPLAEIGNCFKEMTIYTEAKGPDYHGHFEMVF